MMAGDPRSRGLAGRLYQWGQNKVAFESGCIGSLVKIIVLGGLGDGLLACKWVPALSDAAREKEWAVVQPTLTSSFGGHGTSNLRQDAEELTALVNDLVDNRGAEKVAIVGHSTGCQIAVTFMRLADRFVRTRVVAVALQAPVSDQESLQPSLEHFVGFAESNAHRKDDLMPREAHFVPISIGRFLSLYSKSGNEDDDMFSSYLTDDQLTSKLGHLKGVPVLVAYSMSDEYVPSRFSLQDKETLVGRLAGAMGEGAVPLMLTGASHSLAEPADGSAQSAFVRALVEMVTAAVTTSG